MVAAAEDYLGFIGFGEAASAFVEGWGAQRPGRLTAYDIKTDAEDSELRATKRADYARWEVAGCDTPTEALADRSLVFSLVTADQAFAAAETVAGGIARDTLYLDCNSCAPGTKRRSAKLIELAGARYVDVAVMAPVHPALHRTPLLLSGPHAEPAKQRLTELGMVAEVVPGDVGAASSVKMIRSVFVKGLEALVAEGVLAACAAGVDQRVLDSLEASYPGFGWKERSAYMLERVTTHGIRRAAEMREVVRTVDDLGLSSDMARATVEWQQRVGELGIRAEPVDYRQRAEAVLQRLSEK
jgi:3-hydroxyisobutyrate dehydrogenase-like beta-hydroxyacid dehydrogenase